MTNANSRRMQLHLDLLRQNRRGDAGRGMIKLLLRKNESAVTVPRRGIGLGGNEGGDKEQNDDGR